MTTRLETQNLILKLERMDICNDTIYYINVIFRDSDKLLYRRFRFVNGTPYILLGDMCKTWIKANEINSLNKIFNLEIFETLEILRIAQETIKWKELW